eukprot:544404-Lingulodinium_polyedra.AAC.1
MGVEIGKLCLGRAQAAYPSRVCGDVDGVWTWGLAACAQSNLQCNSRLGDLAKCSGVFLALAR